MNNNFLTDLTSLINYLNLDINPLKDDFEILYYFNIIYIKIIKDKKIDNKIVIRKRILEDMSIVDFNQATLPRSEIKEICNSLYKQHVENKIITQLLGITNASLFSYLTTASKQRNIF